MTTETAKEKINSLKIELEKAKEDLEQKLFFVDWLENQIKLEEIKEIIEKAEGGEK